MKNTKLKLMMTLVLAGAMSALALGCGGEDETDEPPAETAQLAEVEDPCPDCDTLCLGQATGGCEDIEPEICEEVAGCELRVFEEQNYMMCFNMEPLECEEQDIRETCELIRGVRVGRLSVGLAAPPNSILAICVG